MIEIRSLNVVTSCIRTVPLRVRFVKLGCPLELVLVVSEVAPGDNVLERLETEAREAGKGLWVDPAPVPPWEWRKRSQWANE